MIRIDSNGWMTDGICRPSPHFNDRPKDEQISLIVIHFISLPAGVFEGEDVDDLFLGRLDCSKRTEYADLEGLRVSSHFVIRRSGELRQYVSTEKRAWHAGISVFEGKQGCNDFSIGIELEGSGEVPFEKAQYETLSRLLPALIEKYPIKAVTGHQFIAPGRKADPGPFFEWQNIRHMLPPSVEINQKEQKFAR